MDIPRTMKALRKTKAAFGAELVEIPVPEIKPNEVLVKVHACSICGTDVSIYEWSKWAQGRIKTIPQTMGHEFTGEVVQVGAHCNRLKIGDIVSVETHIPDNYSKQSLTGQMHIAKEMKIVGVDRDGSMAEYIAIPELVGWKNDVNMPTHLASVQEPLGNAVYCTLVTPVHGQSIAIFGDGPIGLFSVAVARASGATNIILVGLEDFRLELAKQVGADHVINARNENPVQKIMDITGGDGVDIVSEMSGSPIAMEQCFEVVRRGGFLRMFGIFKDKINVDINDHIIFKGITIHGINGRLMFDTWFTLSNLLKSGRLNIEPLITHKLPFEDYEQGFNLMLETPKKCSKVVLYMDKTKLPTV